MWLAVLFTFALLRVLFTVVFRCFLNFVDSVVYCHSLVVLFTYYLCYLLSYYFYFSSVYRYVIESFVLLTVILTCTRSSLPVCRV